MNIVLYCLGLLSIFYLLARICDRYFVQSLDIAAKKLHLSEDVAGATFMAIGSSAPELFTSLIALTKVGSENIGAGTIVGSAIFNILVIVGASAFVSNAMLRWKPVVRDMGFYVISILVLLFTFRDGRISLAEALTYLAFYAVYIFILSRWRHWFPERPRKTALATVVEKEPSTIPRTSPLRRALFQLQEGVDSVLDLVFPNLDRHPSRYGWVFVISIASIIALSYALVELAVGLSLELGIPSVIIALTVLAAGTSVPDLLSSLIVAKQGRGDMAVSNAVGSNTFDILIGLGFPWALFIVLTGSSVTVATENLMSSIFLLFFTVISMFLLLAMQKFHLGRKSGFVLLILYVAYVVYAVAQAYGVGV